MLYSGQGLRGGQENCGGWGTRIFGGEGGKRPRPNKGQSLVTAASVAVGLSAGRSPGSNKIAIILKIFVDVDHLK